MAHAKVFVTALQPERADEAVKGLKDAGKQIRYELGRAMKLRHVPELHFHYDASFDRGERIEQLLQANPPVDDASAADAPDPRDA
jgi:ribosome-binding factor A